MCGCLLGCYTIYTFSGAVDPYGNFVRCKIHFTSKSCVFRYWQRYCTALHQRASAKLCGVVQGMELRNFRRDRHLYSAGRPSRWASAHILVMAALRSRCGHYIFVLFLLLSSVFFLVLSSPNLSGRILDVYHTSTHGVALVRI